MQIEKQGKLVNIRAKNGVVLTTGGFENNDEMRETYARVVERRGGTSSLYNTGDGIKMAMEVGADLWHMEIWGRRGGYGSSSLCGGRGMNTLLFPSHYKSEHLSWPTTRATVLSRKIISAPAHLFERLLASPHIPSKYYLVYDQAQKRSTRREPSSKNSSPGCSPPTRWNPLHSC